MFREKVLILIFTALSLLVVENGDAMGEDTVKPSSDQNQVSELPNDNKGRPVKFRRMNFGGQNRLKTGYSRIIRNLEDLKNFYIEAGGQDGASEAAKIASKGIDFSREVMLIVVNLPYTEYCIGPNDPKLEWKNEGEIKVTLEYTGAEAQKLIREHCPFPGPYPEKFRYVVFQYVIEESVSKVEVFYPTDVKLP